MRKYKDGTLLIKPAKANIKAFLKDIRTLIKKGVALPTEQLIHALNSRLTGWVNYYRTSVSSKVFSTIDHTIVHALLRWGVKRHARKGKRWIVNHYFTTLGGNRWRFYCMVIDKDGQQKSLYLKQAADTKIRRHVKIKSQATPFNPLYKDYFRKREDAQKRHKTIINFNDSAGLKIIQPY